MTTENKPSRKILDELVHFQYDEFCDLLGGATWDIAMHRWLQSGLSQERQRAFLPMGPRFSSENQFLFSENQCGLPPLEILWLKWNLFTELCRKVHLFHREAKRPHLGIHPSHVRVTVPSSVSDLVPSRWIFSLMLDFHSAAPTLANEFIPHDQAVRLFKLPGEGADIYGAPILRGDPAGHEVPVTVLIRSLERVRILKGENLEGIIELHALSDDLRPSKYSKNDVFLVKLQPHDEGSPAFQIWCNKLSSLEKGLFLKGVTGKVSPSDWEKLEKAQKDVFSRSTVCIYHTYHIPCDLYSMGVMLLRVLLVNDQQDILEVDRAVRDLQEGLEPMVQGLDPKEGQTLARRFQKRFGEWGQVFSKESILYSFKETGACWRPIPDDIWADVLILVFRLVTTIPEFSFCHDHGDVELEKPWKLMEKVLLTVEKLGTRIKMELVGSPKRNREIHGACDLLWRELMAEGMGENAL